MVLLGRLSAFLLISAVLGGCVAGPAGIAAAGASALIGALTGSGGAGGAGPRRLTIDPNRSLSEQLAAAQSGATPACRAILARLESAPTGDTPSAAAPTEDAPAAGTAAVRPGEDDVAGPEGTSGSLPASGSRSCEVRPVCLGGAHSPIMVNICTGDSARGAPESTARATPGAPAHMADEGSASGPPTPPRAEAVRGETWRWETPAAG